MVAVNKPGQSNNNITGASGSMPRVKTKTRGVGDYGIFSSSGYVGANRNLNPYDHRGFNALRGSSIVRSNIGSMPRTHYQPQPQSVNTGMSAFEIMSIVMMAMQGLGGLFQSIFQLTSTASSASAAGGGAGSVSDGVSMNSFTGKLRQADSFKDINQLEKDVDKKSTDIKNGYQNTASVKDAKENVKDLNTKLSNVGITTELKEDDMTLSELKGKDTGANIEIVEGDIDKITAFKGKLPDISNEVTTKMNEVKGNISSLDSQIYSTEEELSSINAEIAAAKSSDPPVDTSALETRKQEIENKLEKAKADKAAAEADLKKLEDAKAEIAEMEQKVDTSLQDLENTKKELEDIKKFEDSVADKKYDLAKKQDAELQDVNKKIKDIQAKIDKLTSKNDDAKNNDKLAKLNSDLAELGTKKAALVGSLTLAIALDEDGNKAIENSSGMSYQIKSNLDE